MTKIKRINRLKTKIVQMQADLDKLECCDKVTKYWEPTNEKKCWYIWEDNISSAHSLNITEGTVNTGLVFQTKSEAKDELKRKQAVYRLKKAIWEANGGSSGFIPSKCTYQVSYNTNTRSLGVEDGDFKQDQPSWMYIQTYSKAKQLIVSHKKDFLIYFGIL